MATAVFAMPVSKGDQSSFISADRAILRLHSPALGLYHILDHCKLYHLSLLLTYEQKKFLQQIQAAMQNDLPFGPCELEI